MVRVVDKPKTPFVCPLDTDWTQKITVKGKSPSGSERFSINLQKGLENSPDEVAFHLDFRFNYAGSRRIVINYKKDGVWQTEEIYDGPFPLTEDQDFEVKVYIEKGSFKVNVNGKDLLEVQRKLPCNIVNSFRIEGDIQLAQVVLK